ncbi:MAG TPA: Uma2 family endonuclease [Leptolyngbyaceae cyanobacterium M65_K2018_010]|nr:Uma2 family endonuclease [Leptolyngbyaceae cyanobacterium M65_K2018_010]
MFTVVTPKTIQLPPGAVLRLPGSWKDYQQLVNQLGDRQLPRIKYRPGEILLMAPLPKHGREADVIAAIVRVLLETLEQDYTAFTPITMELVEVSGIEPDYCFYIDHWAAVTGKDRINWEVDPAPDLVIEVDVTSYTDINDYLPYQVPEVWLFRQDQLLIYKLQSQAYSLQPSSRYFPSFPVSQLVLETLKLAFEQNTNAALKSLRQRVASLR